MALPKQFGNWIILGSSALILILIAIVVWARMPLTPVSDESDAIIDVVDEFGARLNMVSLLAPAADVKAAMEREYAPYVSAELLNAWEANPTEAPGRTTSNPHPDGIRVASIQRTSADNYLVRAYVQEVSDSDPPNLGPIEREVLLAIQRDGASWRIVEFTFTGVRPAREEQ